MSRPVINEHRARGTMVLLFLILLGSAANILLALQLRRHVTGFPPVKQQRSDPPCAAIPTRLILEDSACAQKLLTVMNVTNFRILTNASQLPDLNPAIKDRLAKLNLHTRKDSLRENHR